MIIEECIYKNYNICRVGAIASDASVDVRAVGPTMNFEKARVKVHEVHEG